MTKKTITIVGIIILLALAGALAWLFISGRLVYVAPGSTAATGTIVCGSDVVDKYNDASNPLKRTADATLPSVDEPALKDLQNEIKGKKDYAGDATCQNLLFWIAYNLGDYDGAKTANAAVKALYAKGNFPSPNIRSAAPLFSYDTYVVSLSGSDVKGGN